jgi:hypothetical protein
VQVLSKTDRAIGRGPDTQRESSKVGGNCGPSYRAGRERRNGNTNPNKHTSTFAHFCPQQWFFVSYGFVLVQVQVTSNLFGHYLSQISIHARTTQRESPLAFACNFFPLVPAALAFVSYGLVLVNFNIKITSSTPSIMGAAELFGVSSEYQKAGYLGVLLVRTDLGAFRKPHCSGFCFCKERRRYRRDSLPRGRQYTYTRFLSHAEELQHFEPHFEGICGGKRFCEAAPLTPTLFITSNARQSLSRQQ